MTVVGSHRLLALVALALAAGRPLRASAEGDDDADKPFGFIAGHLGLGMPIGSAGVEVGVGISWVRASVGLGMGFKGPQLMAAVGGMFDVSRIGRYPLRVGLGTSFSRGPAVWTLEVGAPGDTGQEEVLSYGERTRWVSGEASLELQVSRTAAWRVYGGLSRAVYKDCLVEIDDGPPEICDHGQRQQLGMLPFIGTGVALHILD